MLIIISSAKTQDFETKYNIEEHSIPIFIEDSKLLIEELKKCNKKELQDLMKISAKLSESNYQKYRKTSFPYTLNNAKQSLLTYKGDVFKNIGIKDFEQQDLNFAQKHLRIISGLYGLLKPLDFIQPYRLEMDINLKNSRGNNVYEFWGEKLTNQLNEEIKNNNNETLINLASNEYSKAINFDKFNGKVLKISFKEFKNGEYKIVGILAKKARGMMVDYIIRNKIEIANHLKDFKKDNYSYNHTLSSNHEMVFSR